MQNPVRVNLFQATFTTLLVTVGTVYFPVAGVVVSLAGPAGWLAVLLAFAVALVWAAMAVSVGSKGPTGSWGDAVKSWLGPWVGRLFLLYFAFIWAWLGGLLLAQGGLVFRNIALPATPPPVLSFALLLLLVLADMRGLEVYIRAVEALAMVSAPLVAAFYLVILPTIDIGNLQPWLGDGLGRIAHAAYICLPWAMEGILFLLFISTHVKNAQGLRLAGSSAIFGGGVALALLTVATLGVLGRGVTEAYLYPTVALAQAARLGFFLQGIEVFLYPLWLITHFFKVGACFVMVSQSVLGLWAGAKQPYRSLVIGVLFFGISNIPASIQQVVASVARVDSTFFMAFYGVLPLLWLWVTFAGKRKNKQKQQETM